MGVPITPEIRVRYERICNLVENGATEGERSAAARAKERMLERYGDEVAESPTRVDREWHIGGFVDPIMFDPSFYQKWGAARGGGGGCSCPACRAKREGGERVTRFVDVEVDGLRVRLELDYEFGRAVGFRGAEEAPR